MPNIKSAKKRMRSNAKKAEVNTLVSSSMKTAIKKFEKEVISMRISTEILEKIDAKAASIGISRNEFINQCISFALANMRE